MTPENIARIKKYSRHASELLFEKVENAFLRLRNEPAYFSENFEENLQKLQQMRHATEEIENIMTGINDIRQSIDGYHDTRVFGLFKQLKFWKSRLGTAEQIINALFSENTSEEES